MIENGVYQEVVNFSKADQSAVVLEYTDCISADG